MNVLIVLTSHDQLGETGHKTGFWLEEFTAPYYTFKDAGAKVSIASPKGGQPPLDPKSNEPESQTASTHRFEQDSEAQQQLAHTLILEQMNPNDFDTVFYAGGHGPLWDLTQDAHSIALIEAFDRAQKPMGFVCHAPAVLKNVKTSTGDSFVAGKKLTGFSNSEEEAVQLTDIVPFLIEDEFKAKGALYEKSTDWQSYVVVEGQLVTGQNPASSEAVAAHLLKLLSA